MTRPFRPRPTNAEISEALYQLAELLEVKGDDMFRIRAFPRAAREVADMQTSLAKRVARGEDLVPLPTIGKDIAAKIEALVKTGCIEELDRAEAGFDPVELRLLKVPGMGPVRLDTIKSHFGKPLSARGLATAAKRGDVARLRGIGTTIERAIFEAFN